MTSDAPPEYAASAAEDGQGAPMASGQEKQGPRGNSRINVLILGETANGKSTLVRQLSIYAGNPNPNVRIGYGDESCTKRVGSHPTSSNLRTYSLKDFNGREIKNVEQSVLIDLTDDDAVCQANDPDEDGKVFDFDLFDTPGLDDSDGNDMEIMADIIGRISQLPHLNAVVYVRSMEKPLGPSFNRFYDYLARCLPMLFNGLIVVHSRFTVDAAAEADSHGRNLAEDRREAFDKATKGRSNASHVFMDNEPDVCNPYAMYKSLNSCYSLLKLLSTQRPLDISTIKLLKAPNMASTDAHILLNLTRLQGSLKAKIDSQLAAASTAKATMMRSTREVNRLNASLSDCQAELAQLDRTNEIVLGSRTVAEDYTLESLLDYKLWLDKRPVHWDSDSKLTRVVKSTGKGCRWLDESQRGTSWRAVLSSSIFRSMHGTATFYTTSQIKHAGEIAQLRARIRDMQTSLTYQKDAMLDSRGAGDLDQDASKLVADAERLQRTIDVIHRDTFDVTLWPVLRKYYLSKTAPTLTEVVDFVAVYDPETARLIQTIRV